MRALQLQGALGRGHALTGADQQRVIEQRAQPAQDVAHGWLGHPQLLCRAGDVFFPKQNIQIDEQIQVNPFQIHEINTEDQDDKLAKLCHKL